MIHPIDKSLLPSSPAPSPRPLAPAAAPPPRLQREKEGVVTTAPEEVMSSLPAVQDPAGREVVVDSRLLTEAMFFRFGFERMSYGKMSEILSASIRWVSRVMAEHSWLLEEYNRGLAVRGQETIVTAEEALSKLVEGYTITKQKLTKEGEIRDLEEEVGPNERATTFSLERLAKDKYGKDALQAPRAVNVQVIMGMNERLAAAGESAVSIQVTEV